MDNLDRVIGFLAQTRDSGRVRIDKLKEERASLVQDDDKAHYDELIAGTEEFVAQIERAIEKLKA